jgi:hypothetical protein
MEWHGVRLLPGTNFRVSKNKPHSRNSRDLVHRRFPDARELLPTDSARPCYLGLPCQEPRTKTIRSFHAVPAKGSADAVKPGSGGRQSHDLSQSSVASARSEKLGGTLGKRGIVTIVHKRAVTDESGVDRQAISNRLLPIYASSIMETPGFHVSAECTSLTEHNRRLREQNHESGGNFFALSSPALSNPHQLCRYSLFLV